jgi:hypothetical protein
MSTGKPTKINKLLQQTPSGVVLASSWLSEQGYSPELIRNYKKSKWLRAFGNGAVVRYHDEIDYLGAVHTMQNQLGMTVHPAAKTALSLLGRAHFLEMHPQQVYLFAYEKEVLPAWFKKQSWEPKIAFHTSSFLPPRVGMTAISHKSFSIEIAAPARAMLECLYLSPDKISLLECHQIMEGLTDLVPAQLQALLENCTSIKVKRLFLYIADKSNHSWLKYINKNTIDLGKGKRSFAKQGKYISQYQITVPKELEEDEYPEI